MEIMIRIRSTVENERTGGRERERNESEIHQMNVEKRKLQVNFCLASERKT